MPRRAGVGAVVGVAAASGLLLGACGGGSSTPRPAPSPSALPPAPEPAVAPPVTVPPAGRVVPVGSPVEGVVVDGPTRTAVAALRGRRLALLDTRTLRLRKTVGVPGTARHLQLARPGGPVLVPGEDTDLLAQVGLPEGDVLATTRVGRQPHDAARDPVSGRIVVADELGGAVSFLVGSAEVARLPGPVQPGGIAAIGGRAAAVDVRGAAVYVYDVSAARELIRLPAGDGPTHVVPLPGDRIAVADTRGNALLLYALDGTPRVIGRLPLPGSPYGIASDPARHRLYVALSATNQLVRFDTSDPAALHPVGPPTPTVRQPNSIGVDPTTGSIVVGSADEPGSVQILPG